MALKNCEHCGGETPPKKRPGGVPKRYCSKGCKDAVRNARTTALVSERRAAARQGRQCTHCGTTFTPQNSSGWMCSKECRSAAHYVANTDAYIARAKVQYERDPEGWAAYHAALYEKLKQDPEWVAARNAYGARHYVAHREEKAAYQKARLQTPRGRALNRAHVTARRAAEGRATPPWQSFRELVDIYEGCPEGHAIDHLHPLKGRHWRGKWQPGDSLLWLLKLPDDAEDIFGNPISTRVSCGLNIPINLWLLETSINSSKSNRPVDPGLFNWWNDDQGTTEGTTAGREWHPSDAYED
jgi:hypothetical protein